MITRVSFLTVGEIVSLPYSLVDAFLRRYPSREGWILLLQFLSPITVPRGPANQGLAMIADFRGDLTCLIDPRVA